MPGQLKANANFLRAIARAEGVAQKEINDILREGGRKAGQWWIENCLEKHFTTQAYNLYRYRPRTAKWNDIKRRARVIDFKSGEKFTATQPPTPMVWTGRLKKYVLDRKSSYQAEATAKFARSEGSQQVTVIVKVPIPHPINPANAGELTRLANSEKKTMRSIIFAYARPKIREAIKRMIQGRGK